jgi:hypothetical protein
LGHDPCLLNKKNEFNNELDFTNLYFENNYDSKLKRRFSYSSHFSFTYQVATYSNYIPLRYELKGNELEEKSLTILYSYLEDALQTSGIVEYFTNLSGKEELPISQERCIHWMEIKTPNDLVLEDREFWGIRL